MSHLTRSATVCALVPHHDCTTWLPGAIESLLAQTRPPDAIVVLDDASPEPPTVVAGRFPEVTFLRTAANVGPYRLVQTAVALTGFDAYLFQDADDLSHPERLAALLDLGEESGAGMVGSHELALDVTAPEVRQRDYPLDVNAALAENPIAFALLHPTSLVTRDTVVRAGGYPGGLRFSGDVDFLWRARHVTRIVNADRHLYVRRHHPTSLTGSPSTGTRSAVRRELDRALRERARANARRVERGEPPDLSPFAPAPPAVVEHLSGPPLGERRTARPRRRARPLRAAPAARARATGPVLVVGGPRNGGDLLAHALDVHPHFEVVRDTGELAHSSRTGRRRVVAGPAVAASALQLADADPDTRIVHVARDVETTVSSLVARPDAHDGFYSEDSARVAAVESGTVCDLLAAALGPDRVMRLPLARLAEEPAAALAACLAFLGEKVVAQAVAPLTGLDVSARDCVHVDTEVTPATARRLLEHLEVTGHSTLASGLRHLVTGSVGEDAVVAVVSRGDDSLLDLGTGRASHFPATDDGSYTGEYPATGQAAVALLEAARARGATHLLIPAPAAWWLTHYGELRDRLDERYPAVASAPATGTLYDLAARQAVGE